MLDARGEGSTNVSGVRFFGSAVVVATALAVSTHFLPATAAPMWTLGAESSKTASAKPSTASSASSDPGESAAALKDLLPSPVDSPTATPTATPVVTPPPPVVTPAPPPPPPAPPAPAAAAVQAGPGSVLHLTFDDGPDARWTPSVLDLLDRFGAKATFFETGWRSAEAAALTAEVRARGHAVGNHTMNHPDLTKLSAAAVRQQVVDADAHLGATTCFRPPYGASNGSVRQQIADLGKRVVLWDVDTQDWRQPGVQVIADRVIAGAKPGAVVLMHDGGASRAQSVAALEIVLTTLSAQGWRFEAIPGC